MTDRMSDPVDPADIIKFGAQVKRVSTTADGGLNITLECGTDALIQAGRLSIMASHGTMVAVAMSALEDQPGKRLGKGTG